MARICELTGKRPMKGSIIWRSGKPKKQGGIGTHITAITKRKFMPNLQRVKALLPSGEVRYIRVSAAPSKKASSPRRPNGIGRSRKRKRQGLSEDGELKMEDGDQTPSSFSFTILNPPSLARRSKAETAPSSFDHCPWTTSSSRV